MALNSANYKQESKFERPAPLEVGTYPGRVVQVISLGLQKQNPYKGEPKDPKHEVFVVYELVDEFLVDAEGFDIEDKPRWINETFTMNSLESDLAKSTKRYYALDPKEKFKGDWSKLVGSPGMISVTQNQGKGDKSDVIYNNVGSVQSMREKEANKLPELVNDTKVFDVDEPDMEVFFSLPTFLQDKIKNNLDYDNSTLEKAIENYVEGEKSDVKEETSSEKTEETSNDEEDW